MQHIQSIKLKDITSKIGSGATPRGGKNSYKTEGMALIRSLNVYDFSFAYEGLAFIDEKQANQLENVSVERDDILLNITGASVCRCCLVPPNVLPARVNQHVSIVRIKPRAADARYVLYAINSPYNKRRLLAIAQGGATREALTKEKIENFEIPTPLLPTQQKISAILSAYDDLIENNLRRIKILEEMAQTLYREWFVKFRFPGHQKVKMVDSPLGKIPERWKIIPFSELLSSTLGGDWGSEEPSTKETHEVGIIRGTDFDVVTLGDTSQLPKRYISAKSFEQRKLFAGDILVENSINAKSRSSGKSILITNGVVKRLGKNTIAASFCRVFRPKDLQLSPLIQMHMKYLFKEGKMPFYQNVAANGIANFQTARFLSQEKIALPTQPEMREYMTDMFQFLNNSILADKNYYLRQTRDLLLPKLISGELDVSELDITIPEANA